MTEQVFSKSVVINADAASVWKALTNVEHMKKWMLEEELEIITDWKVGSPLTILGLGYWAPFKNMGRVLQFEPLKALRYSHLSSVSKLPDEPVSYSITDFALQENGKTTLTLTLSNFPTETIYKHLVFYWTTTLEIVKKFIETHRSF